jgi:hypothetical protein
VTNLKNSFAEVKAGNEVDRRVLSEQYKQFADATIRHFMTDFNKTLDLGMIKQRCRYWRSSGDKGRTYCHR